MAESTTKEIVIQTRLSGDKIPSDARKIGNSISKYASKFRAMFGKFDQMPALKAARAQAQTRSEKWKATHNIATLKKDYAAFIRSKVKKGPTNLSALYGDGWRMYKSPKPTNVQSFGGNGKRITSKDLDLANKIGNTVGKSFGYDASAKTPSNIEKMGTAFKALKTKLVPFIAIAEKVVKAAKKIGSAFLKVAKNVGKLAVQFVKSRIHFGDFIKKFKQFKKAFTRVALYKAIRTLFSIINSGLTTGINNLYKFTALVSGKFQSTMDSFATSWLYAQNAVGAFVGTLLDSLMPAITTLLDGLANAINLLSKFTASLLGTGYYQATKQVQKYSDMVSSAAANQQQLLGFDELNVLSSTGASASGMFGDVEAVASDFKSVEDVIDNITSKINNFVSNFNIDAIAEKCGKTVNKIVGYFNRLMDNIQFEAMGTKLAEGLNKLINTVKPDELGKALTQKINMVVDLVKGFVEEFEWGAAGTWLSNLVASWLGSIKWGNVTSALAGAINGVFEFAKNFLTTTNWKEKAGHLAELLNSLIGKIDWKGVGDTVNEAVQTLLDATIEFLRKIDWKQVGEKIYSALSQINWSDIFTKVGDVILLAAYAMVSSVGSALSSKISQQRSDFVQSGNSWDYVPEDTTTTAVDIVGSKNIKKVLTKASGGTVNTGSLFWAGEAGPELVTSVGGRSTVYNEQQLGASLSYANESVVQAINNLITVVRSKSGNVVISASDIRKAVNSSSMRVGV